jgi:hypothetical protein
MPPKKSPAKKRRIMTYDASSDEECLSIDEHTEG